MADCSSSRFGKLEQKARRLDLDGTVVIINPGMSDFTSFLMRSRGETPALESLSRGQASSLSSCASSLKDALRLREECRSKAVSLAGRRNFPKRRRRSRRESWRQLSHQSHDTPRDNTYEGNAGIGPLIQATLIMRPRGPQIHSHRLEHVQIDRTVTAEQRSV